jgi:glycosyltransferase XagB
VGCSRVKVQDANLHSDADDAKPAATVELTDDQRLTRATGLLTSVDRSLSAKDGLTSRQRLALAILGGALLASVALGAGSVPYALQGVMTHSLQLGIAVLFASLISIRVLAIWLHVSRSAPTQNRETRTAQDTKAPALPVYSVIVALYREAPVVPQLIQALQSLIYPADRLDIILALEANDHATRSAISAITLPAHIRIVIVPTGTPQTKPRALNYALTFARGTFVVVYDAEDQPEPDQLLFAVHAFQSGPPQLACLQASLNIYNPHESRLTTQFMTEYTTLFDAILPALAHAHAPILLGGTSNHFKRDILEAVGGWDAYNVTEDADLGIRLARYGWQVGVLPSTTWEEAPPSVRPWMAQRTRWFKGWMQTYFVHMRQPARLYRELGFSSFVWLQIVLGGGIVSALVHPWFYVTLVWMWWSNTPLFGVSTMEAWTWAIALSSLCAAYTSSAVLAILTLKRRGRSDTITSVIGIPIYWLLMSVAAHAALIEWVRKPFYWAKTTHRPRSVGSPAATNPIA